MKFFNLSLLLFNAITFIHLVSCTETVSEECKTLNNYLDRDLYTPCCGFDAECDENGDFKRLSISNTEIDCGYLPLFPKVEKLILTCELSKFPSNVLEMKKLNYLVINAYGVYNNRFTEPIVLPESIGKDLSIMEHLVLNGLRLKTLPESFSEFKNLKFLDIVYNDFESIPESLYETLTHFQVIADRPFKELLSEQLKTRLNFEYSCSVDLKEELEKAEKEAKIKIKSD